jgi:thiol-disulfide isomerase/thioredoxin
VLPVIALGHNVPMSTRTSVLTALFVIGLLVGCGSSGSSKTADAPSDEGNSSTTVGVCSTQVSACGGEEHSATLEVGKPAPALAGAALDGSGDVNLDSLLGKPTVVVFWSPPCPHCQEELPKIDDLADQLAAKANFMSASIERPDIPKTPGFGDGAEAVATMKLAMPSVSVTREQADTTWKPESFPTAYILDEDHNVVQVIQSAAPASISAALAAKTGVT